MLADDTAVKRGLIRHLLVLLDASESSAEKDLHPSRWAVILSSLRSFIIAFFEQNPIGQLGFLLTLDGRAELLTTDPGLDNTRGCWYYAATDCLSALKRLGLGGIELKGEPSIQNALALARSVLLTGTGHLGSSGYVSREVLFLATSLCVCDPGSLSDFKSGLLQDLKRDQIRVSTISLTAELHLFKMICSETQGRFAVALDAENLRDLLTGFLVPFPMPSQKATSKLLHMGFPKRLTSSSICLCHGAPLISPSKKGYSCPVCGTLVCRIPIECPICSLMLASPLHLIQSYHHLFPLQKFTPALDPAPGSTCTACLEPLETGSSCPTCTFLFCSSCSVLIQEAVYACPGCMK